MCSIPFLLRNGSSNMVKNEISWKIKTIKISTLCWVNICTNLLFLHCRKLSVSFTGTLSCRWGHRCLLLINQRSLISMRNKAIPSTPYFTEKQDGGTERLGHSESSGQYVENVGWSGWFRSWSIQEVYW